MLFAELVGGMLFAKLAWAVSDLVWRSGRTGNMPKVELDWPGKFVSYPVLKPKLSTHSMCAQESSLHTYHT
jgi:hypothetical protein